MTGGSTTRARIALALTIALVIAGCSADGGAVVGLGDNPAGGRADSAEDGGAAQADASVETDASGGAGHERSPATTTVATTPPAPTAEVEGHVLAAGGGGSLAGARVSVGGETVITGPDGSFAIAEAPTDQPLVVERPVWRSVSIDGWAGTTEPLAVELEPVVVRGLRVSRFAAEDPARFAELLSLADDTVVNALVFDTKDESDRVLYDTGVAFAHEIGAVDPVYDPAELLAEARAHDLYAVTRIVTFEDTTWARAKPEARLTGHWVDAADRANWDYPLDLAVEACRIGFDEIQFDYVRFPAGRTAEVSRRLIPPTGQERAETIATFLAEARERLHAEGCGVSAAVFGIVMSSETDQGIGQTPETASAAVDALSPMLYPSHYSPGWLGFPDPNDHPGPVIAHSLDAGLAKVAAGTLVRPWIQGFGYGAANIQAQIDEAEARGAGWIIWNASGTYRRDWLPSS